MAGGDGMDSLGLLYDGLISEEEPRCCKEGQHYLLFLREYQQAGESGPTFMSTNGPYGTYRIVESDVEDWPQVGSRTPLALVVQQISEAVGR
jgi:hypothetical protein